MFSLDSSIVRDVVAGFVSVGCFSIGGVVLVVVVVSIITGGVRMHSEVVPVKT